MSLKYKTEEFELEETTIWLFKKGIEQNIRTIIEGMVYHEFLEN